MLHKEFGLISIIMAAYNAEKTIELAIESVDVYKRQVQVTLSVSECLADLSILDGMETVFVSGVHSHERNIIPVSYTHLDVYKRQGHQRHR